MNLRKFIKIASFSGIGLLVAFASITIIYSNKSKIKGVLTRVFQSSNNKLAHDDHDAPRYLVNPLKISKRQVPPDKIENLEISDEANEKGMWTAPIDWNVTSIHSVLLPNETVMTFGSFGILNKDDGDIRANKKIKISDGRTLYRDNGLYQWRGHDVNSGVDYDLWDIKKGFGEQAHKFYNKPVVMDSFCTVVRVLDKENVFFAGGNLNKYTNLPDTQNGTMIYNIKNGTFKRGKNLKYKRWYGSIVRTGDEKLIIVGGKDVKENGEISYIPEIIDLKNIDAGWSTLEKAASKKLFGTDLHDEWNYPRSYLTSDGNIVGISYNKIWLMDKDDDYRVRQTGEIPLATGGIARHLEHVNTNLEPDFYEQKIKKTGHDHHGNSKENMFLKIVSMGGSVGSTTSTVMKGKDQVYLFGGKQFGEEYTSSNKVYKIDFSSSTNPNVLEMKNMLFPRSNANATILPNGEIFINGGEAYNDNEFSIFTPEIYNVDTGSSRPLSDSYFKRNYHSTSLLLPDGRILVSGGDVWNSEIFYPPYFFEKDWNNNTVLAKRPKIINLKDEIKREDLILEIDNNSDEDISMVTILSTGSTTHAQASEPKFISLQFKKLSDKKLLVDIPKNPDQLANGTYMIFLVKSNGVPSVGEIVFLN